MKVSGWWSPIGSAAASMGTCVKSIISLHRRSYTRIGLLRRTFLEVGSNRVPVVDMGLGPGMTGTIARGGGFCIPDL